ncbi:SPOR domain-containing protein [Aurantimonas sp. MSK8Z-1]|uniref:SPOR domain-containing protein n=1 Tax=Mangrovibrevibacter kandeliae TaxID=2968473 RepID=UPI0021180491|nr:serine hydrolase [Aurantimonas sp. MSK8Z-1]MCW4114637.1 SPOR domain-containing protein [Aurantimonas sp. MSK8Z-1]
MRLNVPSLDRLLTRIVPAVSTILLTASLLTAHAATAAERYADFIIDANTGKVLHSENADDARYPASLTKMMTLYLTFEALEGGRISMDTPMPVSRYAAARPPSKLGLKPGSTLKVEEAIYSLVTRSANDAAVVLAEYLGGSEDRFAELMTAKARQLGMTRTVFKNANGLPNPGQHVTARDMATLGIALREHFPKQYSVFKTRSYNFRGQVIGNHNRMLGRIDGVDGIKTGFINASGFNLVTSVAADGKKVVGVVMGGRTAAARDNQMAKLLRQYLPQASRRDTGDLVADARPVPGLMADALPKEGPVPSFRAHHLPNPDAQSIEARIAMAYGTDEAAEVGSVPAPRNRPVVGRDAVRAALAFGRRPANAGVAIPVANSLAPVATTAPTMPARTAPSRRGPMPPAAIPGGADLDPRTTGSVVAAAKPTSPWVVQIAAVPDRDNAMSMLADAKRQGGSALADAEAFTETVGAGAQTLYRARFAGFDTKSDAWDACAALKRRSYACYAVAN